MRKLKTDVTRAVALATLLGGLGACAESEGEGVAPPAGGDPVEAAIANLGTPIDGCDATTPVTGTGFANTTLTFNVGTSPLVLSAGSQVFSANGYKCTQKVSVTGKPDTYPALKTSDVKQIVINGSAADNKVILDFLPGTFGTSVLSATGGIKIDFSTNSGAGNDSVMIRGGTAAEKYKFGEYPMAGPTTDILADVTGDSTADIDIKLSASGTLSLTASMGGGNDVVSGNPSGADINAFNGLQNVTVAPLSSKYGLTAYGGPNDDTFTGGAGDDAFYGGDGNDTFKATGTTASDGADIYSGDADEDTVDYSSRTAAIAVDLGPPLPAVEGGVDLRTSALYGSSSILNTSKLTFVIDGKRITTAAFSSPAKPKDILDAINTAANTAIPPAQGAPAVVYATMNGKNHLVINSVGTDPTTSFVKVESNPAIAAAASANAETTLGLSTGAASAFPLVGGDISVAGLYGSSSTLDAQRLSLIVNGVFVTYTFDKSKPDPADVSGLLADINGAINTALGTTAVKYATQNGSGNNASKLELTATTLVVLDGALASTATTPAVVAADVAAAPLLGFNSRVEGTVDATTAGLYTAVTGTLVSTTLSVVVDGARVDAPLTATPTSAAAVIAIVNPLLNTALNTTNVKYMSLSPTKHFMFTSNSDVGGVSAVSFPSVDPALATATTAAETGLGLSGSGAKLVGADLSLAGTYTAIANSRLVLVVNGTYYAVSFVAPAIPSDVTTAINTAVGSTIATQNATTKKLELAATWITVKQGDAAYNFTSATAAAPLLGLGSYYTGTKRDVNDADDGLVDEHDDVRYSTENITGGSGNDVLIGNNKKNKIIGGDGNDLISGGANGATCVAALGDVLTGGNGDDTFILPAANCRAQLTGNDGNNAVDFSGRSAALTVKNNGQAASGEAAGAEAVTIATDVKKMVGGFDVDTMTGGASDETFVGGPGGDIITGGTGFDTMDYSASPAGVTVTLCFAAQLTSCTADDGILVGQTSEGDNIWQVEHLIGSAFRDDLSAATATVTETTIEGGAGDDVITGGGAVDTLWGDAGDDHLIGGAGADQLSGDAGDDWLEGGDSDQDICLSDSSDVTHPKTTCEL